MADVDQYVGLLNAFLDKTGPTGAIIAAVIVGLGLLLIVYAKSAGIFDSTRTERQKTDFLDLMISQVEKLSEREGDLQSDLDRVERECDRLKDKMREQQTKTELMRNQLRRAIDLLRAVREGRLPPEAIEAADTMQVLP